MNKDYNKDSYALGKDFARVQLRTYRKALTTYKKEYANSKYKDFLVRSVNGQVDLIKNNYKYYSMVIKDKRFSLKPKSFAAGAIAGYNTYIKKLKKVGR